MSQGETRLAILDVLHGYCHAYDGGDIDGMVNLFMERGSFEFTPPPAGFPARIEGRTQIRAGMSARKSATAGSQRRHLITNVLFDEVDELAAKVRSYLTLASTTDGKLSFLATGVYDDRLRNTPDGWRFESRRLKLDLTI